MTARLSSNSVGASRLDRRVAVTPMMDWTDYLPYPSGTYGDLEMLVAFTSPAQPLNFPKCPEIPQGRVAWKALEK